MSKKDSKPAKNFSETPRKKEDRDEFLRQAESEPSEQSSAQSAANAAYYDEQIAHERNTGR